MDKLENDHGTGPSADAAAIQAPAGADPPQSPTTALASTEPGPKMTSTWTAEVPKPNFSPAPEDDDDAEVPVPTSRSPQPEQEQQQLYTRSRGDDGRDQDDTTRSDTWARRSRSPAARDYGSAAGDRAATAPMRPFSPGGRPLKCFVGNLNPDCRLFNLREKFAPYGSITNVEIKTNLGCGFVVS